MSKFINYIDYAALMSNFARFAVMNDERLVSCFAVLCDGDFHIKEDSYALHYVYNMRFCKQLDEMDNIMDIVFDYAGLSDEDLAREIAACEDGRISAKDANKIHIVESVRNGIIPIEASESFDRCVGGLVKYIVHDEAESDSCPEEDGSDSCPEEDGDDFLAWCEAKADEYNNADEVEFEVLCARNRDEYYHEVKWSDADLAWAQFCAEVIEEECEGSEPVADPEDDDFSFDDFFTIVD